MHALIAKGYGDVELLEYRDMPEPRAGKGEIKVKVAAAGINPIDWKMLSGVRRAVMELDFPAILGRDAAGEVVEVGEGVTGRRVGDRVLGLTWRTFAQYTVGPATAWAKLPEGLAAPKAAALPLALLTGAQLADCVTQPKGAVVLVTGALGSVGRTAVFVARRAGAQVWAGVRKSQVEQARKLGAEGIVALDDDADLAKLPPLDAVCDTVNGETMAKLLARLRKDGVVGSVVGAPAKAKELGIRVNAFMAQAGDPRLSELAAAVAQGKLDIPLAREAPLSEGRDAVRFARDEANGKVVLIP